MKKKTYLYMALPVIIILGIITWSSFSKNDLELDSQELQRLAESIPNGKTYVETIQKVLPSVQDADKKGDEQSYITIAAELNNLGAQDKAIEYYNEALRLSPKNTTALNNLANIYQDRMDWDKAERNYREILDVESQNTMAYRALATLYRYRFNDPEKKIKDLIDMGLEATNSHPDLLTWIIAYYQEKNKGDLAIPYSQKMIEHLNKK